MKEFGADYIDDFSGMPGLRNKYNICILVFNRQEILQAIQSQGIFPDGLEARFAKIGSHDFVFGPHLHGCVAALIQAVPAVMIPRDLRVREKVEMFNLPAVDYREIEGKTIEDIYRQADFEKFQNTYKVRYSNYLSFIAENGLDSNLASVPNAQFHL